MELFKGSVFVKPILAKDLEIGMLMLGSSALPLNTRKQQQASAPQVICGPVTVTQDGVKFMAGTLYSNTGATYHMGLDNVVYVICNGVGKAKR